MNRSRRLKICDRLRPGPLNQSLPMVVLGTLIASVGCSRIPRERVFWEWFQTNENALFDFEKDRERTFDRIAAEMHKLNSNLTFEFGPKEDGRREFTISADGIRSAFPLLSGAAGEAVPRLNRASCQLALLSHYDAFLHQLIEVRGVLIVFFADVLLQTRSRAQHDLACDMPGLGERLGIL